MGAGIHQNFQEISFPRHQCNAKWAYSCAFNNSMPVNLEAGNGTKNDSGRFEGIPSLATCPCRSPVLKRMSSYNPSRPALKKVLNMQQGSFLWTFDRSMCDSVKLPSRVGSAHCFVLLPPITDCPQKLAAL